MHAEPVFQKPNNMRYFKSHIIELTSNLKVESSRGTVIKKRYSLPDTVILKRYAKGMGSLKAIYPNKTGILNGPWAGYS